MTHTPPPEAIDGRESHEQPPNAPGEPGTRHNATQGREEPRECPCGGACHENPAYTHGHCCDTRRDQNAEGAREAAYGAVYAYIATLPGGTYAAVVRNAHIWRGVTAALDALDTAELERLRAEHAEDLAAKVETAFACTGFHGNGCSTADCCGIHAEAVARFLRTGVKRDDY